MFLKEISTPMGCISFENLDSARLHSLMHHNFKKQLVMANIYQVEIYETSAYIYLRQPNGTILECKQCSVSTAQKFISSNGLGFMLDDGECKTYIS